MSQTGSAGVQHDDGFEPLIIYNCVHHREQNAIARDAATAEAAAQIYNAVLALQGGISQGQMTNIHPLNFASIPNGAASLSGITRNEVEALAEIARGDAEAQRVLLANYQQLTEQQAALATIASDQLVANLGALDEIIRAQSDNIPIQRG